MQVIYNVYIPYLSRLNTWTLKFFGIIKFFLKNYQSDLKYRPSKTRVEWRRSEDLEQRFFSLLILIFVYINWANTIYKPVDFSAFLEDGVGQAIQRPEIP